MSAVAVSVSHYRRRGTVGARRVPAAAVRCACPAQAFQYYPPEPVRKEGTVEESLLAEGMNLMLFGMLTVVLFLALLVVVVSAMSALLARFAPTPSAGAPALAVAAVPSAPDPAVVAAITAALALHRGRRNHRNVPQESL